MKINIRRCCYAINSTDFNLRILISKSAASNAQPTIQVVADDELGV